MAAGRHVTAFLTVLGVLGGVLAPPASAQAPKKLVKAKMAQSADSYISAPTYIAQAKKFFEAEGVDLDLITVAGGSAVLNALVGGSVDVGYSGFEHLAKARKNNVQLTGVTVTVLGLPFVLVITNEAAKKAGVQPGDPLEKRMRAMKGLRLGYSSPGSQSETVLKLLLKKEGLDPARDATLAPLRTELNMVSAFRTNQVDGLNWNPPIPEKLVHEKLGMILLSGPRGEMPVYPGNVIFDHLYLHERYMKERPEVVQGLVNAYTRAAKFARENQREVVEIIKRRFAKEDPGVVELAMETMQPMIAIDLDYKKADAEATIAGVVEGVDIMAAVTNRFVEEARKRIQ